MNCHECQELVQRILDGASIAAHRQNLEPHLAICTHCREFHAASQRLLEGLRMLPPALPPANLSREITARVVSQTRRLRFQRRVAMTTALAASLLLVVLTGYRLFEGGETAPMASSSTSPVELAPSSEAPPSFDRSVAEAGLAVMALTRRTAGETVAQGKLLLPVVVPDGGFLEQNKSRVTPEPGASLQEVRQTVSAGLEPVTTSARRAVDLFLREIPSMPLERKSGL